MPFTWQIPYQPPDPAAIERMRRTFPRPDGKMHIAWFMGNENENYMEWQDIAGENLTGKDFAYGLSNIRVGYLAFPKVAEDVNWEGWFQHALPSALMIVNSTRDDSWNPGVFEGLFGSTFLIYPNEIPDEYPGYRNDFVYSLGTRIFPELLTRDDLSFYEPESGWVRNPIFTDIWDFSRTPDMEKPGTDDVFNLPMLFCLKYLNATELETWAESLLKIDSPQWRLATLTWWVEFHTNGLNKDYGPYPNFEPFRAHFKHLFTRDTFTAWAADIRSHRDWMHREGPFPVQDELLLAVDTQLRLFEQHFFGSVS